MNVGQMVTTRRVWRACTLAVSDLDSKPIQQNLLTEVGSLRMNTTKDVRPDPRASKVEASASNGRKGKTAEWKIQIQLSVRDDELRLPSSGGLSRHASPVEGMPSMQLMTPTVATDSRL